MEQALKALPQLYVQRKLTAFLRRRRHWQSIGSVRAYSWDMADLHGNNLAYLMAQVLVTTGPFVTDDPDAEINERLAVLIPY